MATLSKAKRTFRRVRDGAILEALTRAGHPLCAAELAAVLAAAGMPRRHPAALHRTLARLAEAGAIVKHVRRDCEPVTFSRCGPTQAPATVETPPAEAEALALRVLSHAEKPLSDQQTAWRASVYSPVTLPEARAALARLVAEGQVVEHEDGTFTAAVG